MSAAIACATRWRGCGRTCALMQQAVGRDVEAMIPANDRAEASLRSIQTAAEACLLGSA